MNKLERFIYNRFRENASLKIKVRNIYQGVFDLLPNPKIKSAYPIIERKGFFYGFHDHTPFSADDSMLLANHASFDLRMPKKNEILEVGFFNGEGHKNFNCIAETRAWNWHMGSKLQWCGNGNKVIFNDHIDGMNVARVIDINNSKETVLSDSIASVSPDGKWAVGYSFARVEKLMPGYGYTYTVQESDLDVDIPETSGIYRIDINSGDKKELISINDLASIDPLPSMKGTKHFLTHTVISPDSSSFIFLHRWVNPEKDISKRFSRLIVCDIDGNILDIFKTDGMVSHIGWQDSEHVLAYCRDPIFDDKYVLFKIGNPEESLIIGKSTLTSDGHPSYDNSGRWIVTDTYQDRRRVQNLVLHDTKTDTRYDIAKIPGSKEFQSPSPYQHWACDLHPRWSRNANLLCFDAIFQGERSLCTLNLENDLLEENLKYIERRDE
jgi:hypothetical protein